MGVFTLVPAGSDLDPTSYEVPALPIIDGPLVQMPLGRDYLLFKGSLATAAKLPDPLGGRDVPGRTRVEHRQSPNLFWLADRAWCVGSEIDLFDTLVAGSEALAAALAADPILETLRVGPDDPITHDSDLINSPTTGP